MTLQQQAKKTACDILEHSSDQNQRVQACQYLVDTDQLPSTLQPIAQKFFDLGLIVVPLTSDNIDQVFAQLKQQSTRSLLS